jgi:hypothetical protein
VCLLLLLELLGLLCASAVLYPECFTITGAAAAAVAVGAFGRCFIRLYDFIPDILLLCHRRKLLLLLLLLLPELVGSPSCWPVCNQWQKEHED